MGLALVTGASRGIGRAIACTLAADGFDVIVHCHSRRAEAAEVVESIQALGRQAFVAQFDVGAGADTEAAVKELLSSRGVPDALVNNAGFSRDGLFPTLGRESWQSVLDTNLGAFYSVTRPVVRQMLRRRFGRIVSIASVAGERGNAGQVNYAASKAGIVGATKALALEVAPRNITVNAVSPGLIETDMLADVPVDEWRGRIPMQRVGTPEEVAAAVSFLCSQRASYITGHVLDVNGGLYT